MDNTIYAFAIDPGISTGWAVIGVDSDSIFGSAPGNIQDWQFGQIDGPLTGQVVTIRSLIKRFSPAAFISEDFSPREANSSAEYISPIALRSMCQLAVSIGYIPDIPTVHLQMPGLAMSTATDQRLRVWGLYSKGSRHARDATRHAITFIRRAKSDSRLRREAWRINNA